MSGSTTSQRRSRLGLIISAVVVALSAAILFVGSVAANLLAEDLNAALKQYKMWVWGVLIASFVVTIVIAVVGYLHKQGKTPDPQDETPPEREPPPAPRSKAAPAASDAKR